MIDPLSAPDDVWFQKGSVARFQSWRGLWAERREKRSIGSSLSPRRSLHYQASPPRLLVTTTTLDVVRMLWRSVIIDKHNYSPWSKLKKLCRVFLHRLPQCVSERLLEGAVVRGARRKPVPAEGPRGPAAARRHGAAQRCRGGARRPRPQTSLLFLHPAVGERASVSRGDLLVHQSLNLTCATTIFCQDETKTCSGNWRVCGFGPSGQQLRGSGSLAGRVVCRDWQHQPAWGAALRLHRRGHAHWHTTRCQTLLPVSHSLKISCALIHLFCVSRHVYCVFLKHNCLWCSQMGHNYCCLLQ